jgi:hypothetical protein
MEDDDQNQYVHHELNIQVQALAQRLDQTRNRHVGIRDANQNSSHEADWAASHLLARILMQSQQAETFPNRTNLENLLQANGFDKSRLQSLEAKFWVRFVLGQPHIPRSIRSAISAIQSPIRHDSEKEHIDDYVKQLGVDKDILETITTFLKKKNHFWISRALLQKLREAHRQAHTKTPTIKKLVELGVIEPCTDIAKDKYVLTFYTERIESEKNLWQVLQKRIFSLLWEWLCDSKDFADDIQRVQKWIESASEFDEFYELNKYISAAKKEHLNAAIQTVLMSESDIQGREFELEKLRWETDYGFGRLLLEPLPVQHYSFLDAWKWWNQLEEITQRSGFSRQKFESMFSIAIRELGWYQQSEFLKKCLENSFNRPYLLYCVVRNYKYAHRSELARLLQEPKTASLGLYLIQEINLRDNLIGFNENYADSEIKQKIEKTQVWEKAISIICEVIKFISWSSQDWLKIERFDAMVVSLGEILLFSAQKTVQAEHQLERNLGKQELNELQTRFKILTSSLASLDAFEDYILPIYKWLMASVEQSKSESSTSESMRIAEMKVLFWLLEVSNENSPIAVTIAQGITELYCQEIRSWKVENQSRNFVISWHDAIYELMDFPWAKVARVLITAGQLDALIQPDKVDLVLELRSVERSIKGLVFDETGYPEYSLFRSWLQKIRTHILVLLRIHRELKHGEAPSAKKIELKIRDLIIGSAGLGTDKAQIGLFSHDLDNPFRRRRKAHFVYQVTQGIHLFSADDCKRTFLAWIEKEDYPDVLLAIVEDSIFEDVRQAALARIEQQDLYEYLNRQFLITGYERLLINAANAGETKVAKQVLEYMESAQLNDTQKTNWLIFSHRIRLMIAYQENDLKTINTLKFPTLETYVDNQSPKEIQKDFENSRTFFRSLLELESNPQKAYEGFHKLFQNESTNTAYAVNRFAAAVRLAQANSVHEIRKQALSVALEEWRAATPNFSENALREISRYSCYSELIVLDELEMDLRFDEVWQNLANDLKITVAYVDIAVKNGLRRDKKSVAEGIYEAARPYHTNSVGAMAAGFAEIQNRFNGLDKKLFSLTVTQNTDTDKLEKWRAVWHEITQLQFNVEC